VEHNKPFTGLQAIIFTLLPLLITLVFGLIISVKSNIFVNQTSKYIRGGNQTNTDRETQKRIEKFRLAMLSTWQNQAFKKGLAYNRPEGFQGVIINQAKVTRGRKLIALTFDDGPWDNHTREILDILKKNQVRATFFVLGQALKNKPDIGRRIVNDGHVIANHTWNHRYHYHNPQAAAFEIDRTSELIYQTTGAKTNLFRPPGGMLNNGLVAYAKEKNYTIVMWSADSNDYKRPSVGTLVTSVVKQSTPGGIILLHDGGGNRSNTVESLAPMIKKLKGQGYTFATIPELLEADDRKHKLAESQKNKSLRSKT